jgi:hypothetical protein
MVMLVPALNNQRASALILRDATEGDRIVLSADAASAGTLGAAVLALLQSRATIGDVPPRSITLRLPINASAELPKRDQAVLARALTHLQSAPQQPIAGLGLGSTTKLYMPTQEVLRQRLASGKLRFTKANHSVDVR